MRPSGLHVTPARGSAWRWSAVMPLPRLHPPPSPACQLCIQAEQQPAAHPSRGRRARCCRPPSPTRCWRPRTRPSCQSHTAAPAASSLRRHQGKQAVGDANISLSTEGARDHTGTQRSPAAASAPLTVSLRGRGLRKRGAQAARRQRQQQGLQPAPWGAAARPQHDCSKEEGQPPRGRPTVQTHSEGKPATAAGSGFSRISALGSIVPSPPSCCQGMHACMRACVARGSVQGESGGSDGAMGAAAAPGPPRLCRRHGQCIVP